MYKKGLQIPVNLLQLIALKRRLLLEHPKIPLINKSYNIMKKGFNGERTIDYQLRYLNPAKYFIFHDIRLSTGITHFQIDFLLLTPFLNIIVEVKNIGGTLYFDPVFNQLIRRKPEGKEDVFPDPTFQVERQKSQLNKWVIENNLPIAPIRYIIAISDSDTILKTSLKNHNISKWIAHHWVVANTIESLEQHYKKEMVSQK